ncbi:hypothetical protein ACNQ08_28320, partial [Enterobacter cloacae complex sp.6730661]|uniref:hypothetical protein n=1 Tax=Enterobacter cloacae complex sp.6730661 TaxID=3397169 RepID=UPI003AAD9DB0
DIGVLEYARTKSGKLKRRFAGGTGMADVLDPATLEQLVAGGQSVETDAEAKAAPIELNTIMVAEPGKTISGEDICGLV